LRTEYRVGLTLLAALLIVYFSVLWLKKGDVFYRNAKYYYVASRNVNGLLKDDPVKIHGYEVGKVEDIHLLAQHAVVKILIWEPVTLYENATAEIRIREVLSGKQIDIFPGDSGRTLNVGDTINALSTFDFSLALSEMGHFFQGFDIADIVRSLKRLDTLLILLTSDSLHQRLNASWTQLDTNLVLLKRTLKEVERTRLLLHIQQTLVDLNQRLEHLNYTLSLLDTTLLQVHSTELIPQVDRSLREIEKLSQELRPLLIDFQKDSTLFSTLLKDPSLPNRLSYTLHELDSTLQIINQHRLTIGIRIFPKKKREKR